MQRPPPKFRQQPLRSAASRSCGTGGTRTRRAPRPAGAGPNRTGPSARDDPLRSPTCHRLRPRLVLRPLTPPSPPDHPFAPPSATLAAEIPAASVAIGSKKPRRDGWDAGRPPARPGRARANPHRTAGRSTPAEGADPPSRRRPVLPPTRLPPVRPPPVPPIRAAECNPCCRNFGSTRCDRQQTQPERRVGRARRVERAGARGADAQEPGADQPRRWTVRAVRAGRS